MILVTGGTGLIGSHLLHHLLASDKEVRALYRNDYSLRKARQVFSEVFPEKFKAGFFDRIQWVPGDITEVPSLEAAFEGVDQVYHCAAQVSFDHKKKTSLRKNNIEGTANVVNACIRNRVQKLCHVSSIATFDQKPRQDLISEMSHWDKERDHTMYAITKYGAEMEVWRGTQEGVPAVIVNPGVVIGSGLWNSGSGRIFSAVYKGLPFYVPKTTGFVGVGDVVKIMNLLMESDLRNEQFILVSQNCSFKEIFEQVAHALGRPVPKWKLQAWMIGVGWVFQKVRSSIFGTGRELGRQSMRTLFTKSQYSNTKIREQLQYEFEPIDQVIARTAADFKSAKGISTGNWHGH